MEILLNPLRSSGLPPQDGLAEGAVSTDACAVLDLLRHCPAAAATPLVDAPELAAALDVGALHIKDERERMGLGSFKALGAFYVIARAACSRAGVDLGGTVRPEDLAGALAGVTYVCASAGNHGLSVAAGARVFGAGAVIYLSDTVPEAFADRLRRLGARVVRAGAIYEQSMAAAAQAAEAKGWVLLSDSSWPGYTELPHRVMEGYLAMGAEAADAIEAAGGAPSHILLQAGVGGVAAAMAAYFRGCWGAAPVIIVVEPDAAATLMESVRAGRPVKVAGPASNMGRLDCKEPSHLALAALARDADFFVTISDAQAEETVELLAVQGFATTCSGAAGIAALQHAGAQREALGLTAQSRVLALMTEGPE